MRRIHLIFAGLVVVAAMTLAACGGSSSSSASSKFCDLMKSSKTAHVFSGGGSMSTLADAKKNAPALKVAIDELTAVAPPQIKADLQTNQRFMTAFANAVKSAESQQDLRVKVSGLTSQGTAVDAAGSRVDQYSNKHCGTKFSG